MKQWIGGLLATIVGGVTIYWFTQGFSTHGGAGDPPIGHMGEIQWRTNLQGSDIANIDKPEVNTAGECSELCLKNSHCKAMTFVQHPTGAGGICWLKDAAPAPSMDANMQSAVKLIP
jgi:hypothetical protein